MELKRYALKRALGTALVGLLLSSTPLALAGTGGAQPVAEDEKPDITLERTIFSDWELSTTGLVRIDGRSALAVDRLMSGSRITVDALSSARAEIKGVGRVTIAPKSEIVLDTVDGTIVARMMQGTMNVEVAARYGAFVETPDTHVVAHRGAYASFKVKAIPGSGTSVDRGFGDVQVMAIDRDKDGNGGWRIKPIGEDGNDDDDDIDIAARKRGQIRVKVKNSAGTVVNQPVTFTVSAMMDGATGSFPGGAQRITAQTNSDGVVSVPFDAGASSGKILIEASIPGTDVTDMIRVTINATRIEDRHKSGKIAILSVLAAGAVAGTVLAVMNSKDEEPGGATVPPPVVTIP